MKYFRLPSNTLLELADELRVVSIVRPMVFEELHLPAVVGCEGCFPHERYSRVTMWVVERSGRKVTELVATIRVCLN